MQPCASWRRASGRSAAASFSATGFRRTRVLHVRLRRAACDQGNAFTRVRLKRWPARSFHRLGAFVAFGPRQIGGRTRTASSRDFCANDDFAFLVQLLPNSRSRLNLASLIARSRHVRTNRDRFSTPELRACLSLSPHPHPASSISASWAARKVASSPAARSQAAFRPRWIIYFILMRSIAAGPHRHLRIRMQSGASPSFEVAITSPASAYHSVKRVVLVERLQTASDRGCQPRTDSNSRPFLQQVFGDGNFALS